MINDYRYEEINNAKELEALFIRQFDDPQDTIMEVDLLAIVNEGTYIQVLGSTSIEDRRWVSEMKTTFKVQERIFEVLWDRALTECQESNATNQPVEVVPEMIVLPEDEFGYVAKEDWRPTSRCSTFTMTYNIKKGDLFIAKRQEPDCYILFDKDNTIRIEGVNAELFERKFRLL